MPVHTPLPSGGELKLAEQLIQLADTDFHLWFGVDYLRGVNDIDLLLWDRRTGVFVIEVKAVPLSMIQSATRNFLAIEGRDTGRAAHLQAHTATKKLGSYLDPRMRHGRPFLIPSAWFPLITREEWNAATFIDPVLRSEGSQSLLFKDELASLAKLREQLSKILKDPPSGNSGYFSHKDGEFRQFSELLDVQTPEAVVRTDVTRIRILESVDARKRANDAPPDTTSRLMFVGQPGTGKTFRLLEIALQHALAKKRVLFLCFNKALAADLRRLISHRRKAADNSASEIEIHDLFEFLSSFDLENGDFQSPDEWASSVVNAIRSQGIRPIFDTILVDEAQDLKPWAVELVTLLMTEQTTVCVAKGSGQELYGDGSSTLSVLGLKQKSLRRSFRSSRPSLHFAQVIHESRLENTRLDKSIEQVLGRSATKNVDQLEFESEDGQLPTISRIDDLRGKQLDKTSAFYVDNLQEINKEAVTVFLRGLLPEIQGADKQLIDTLILVPSDSSEYLAVKEALKDLKVNVTDLVDTKNRRHIALPDAVRMTTFHSSRGLEAERTIIFGFQSVDRLSKEVDADGANLAYIALSRAKRHCHVATFESQMQRPVAKLLVAAHEKLSAKVAYNIAPGSLLSKVAEVPPRYAANTGRELQLRKDDDVTHEILGVGIVVEVKARSEQIGEAVIYFESGQTHTVPLDDRRLNRVL